MNLLIKQYERRQNKVYIDIAVVRGKGPVMNEKISSDYYYILSCAQ